MTISRYRARPNTVEAIRWTGENNCEEVFTFLGWDHGDDDSFHEEIYDIGDNESAQLGDWIVLGADGEHHVMTDEQFTAAFEAAGDE